ncbi:MAG: hypothetical protein ACTHWZ_03880 [Peptoniphilaceae bacterium]
MRILVKEDERREFNMIYGGIFFVGLILSTMFILGTSLVIYYKQLSEGYEDVKRFRIFRRVGMTEKEVKTSINSQVRTVFLLPPIVAGVHMCAVFPVISFMLNILGVLVTKYKIIAFLIVYIVYLLFYLIVYKLTSRVYYRIVSK